MPTLAHGYERHLGKPGLGSGHCVALVRECSGLPATAQWRQGAPVRDNDYPPGTCIATFDAGTGRYGNHMDGRSHACILVAENKDGLLVVDQWLNESVHQRTIRFRNGRGDAANDGDRYFAIELADDTPG